MATAKRSRALPDWNSGKQVVTFRSGSRRRRLRSRRQADKLANGGKEMKLPCVQRPTEPARFRHGEERDRAAHSGDTVERKALARHFAWLLPVLLHYFHAVGRHRANRHFDHGRARATGERCLLTEQAGQRADQQEQGKQAFHDEGKLAMSLNTFNSNAESLVTSLPISSRPSGIRDARRGGSVLRGRVASGTWHRAASLMIEFLRAHQCQQSSGRNQVDGA